MGEEGRTFRVEKGKAKGRRGTLSGFAEGLGCWCCCEVVDGETRQEPCAAKK